MTDFLCPFFSLEDDFGANDGQTAKMCPSGSIPNRNMRKAHVKRSSLWFEGRHPPMRVTLITPTSLLMTILLLLEIHNLEFSTGLALVKSQAVQSESPRSQSWESLHFQLRNTLPKMNECVQKRDNFKRKSNLPTINFQEIC